MTIYLLSVSQVSGPAKGAMLLEFESEPNVMAFTVDPSGEDTQAMELGRFYSREEMTAMNYTPEPILTCIRKPPQG